MKTKSHAAHTQIELNRPMLIIVILSDVKSRAGEICGNVCEFSPSCPKLFQSKSNDWV